MSTSETKKLAHRRLLVSELHPHLMCILCGGYYVDATTIIECLHSFCKSCLVRYLESNKYCPICEVQVHKTKPLLNIRPDDTLQTMVYKLVPGLFQREMRFRREFYAQHPDAPPSSPEDRGIVDPIECQFYSPDEPVSLELEFKSECSSDSSSNNVHKRYLRCPAAVTIAHLQKLVRNKYGLLPSHHVDVMFGGEPLMPDLSLMDVAYTFQKKRKEQFHFTYCIVESKCKKRRLESPVQNPDHQEEMEVDVTPSPTPTPMSLQSVKNAGSSTAESKSKLDSIISRLGSAKQTENVTKKGESAQEWKEVQLEISESGVMSVRDMSSIEKLINTVERNVGLLSKKESSGSQIKDGFSERKSPKLGLPVPGSVVMPGKKNDLTTNNAGEKELKSSPSPVTSNHVEKLNESLNLDDKKRIPTEEIPEKKINDDNNKYKSEKNEVKTSGKSNLNPSSTPPPSVAHPNIPVKKLPVLGQSSPAASSFSKPSAVSAAIPPVTSSNLCVTLGSSQVTLSIAPSPSVSSSACVTPVSISVTKVASTAHTTTTVARATPVPVSKAVTNTPTAKKQSSSPAGYKTLKCGPKNWNPTISRNSVLSSKAEQQPQQGSGAASGSGSSSSGKPPTPPRFFKMRNTPRYLGNPASGVKAMYQVPESKPETPPPAKSPSVMKLDPRTLTPIVSNATSPTSKSSPVQPKGRPPFPSTTLSAQVNNNHMPSSRSVTTATTTSSAATKHANISSLQNSSSQPLVNPFLPNPFMHKGMPNFLFGVGPGLLPSGPQFANILRPTLGYPPVTAGGFHPALSQQAGMLFNPHQLHRHNSSAASPTGFPPSLPSQSVVPLSSPPPSSLSLSSKTYALGQRVPSEKSLSSLNHPQSSSSLNPIAHSTGQESGKVNGSETSKNSTSHSKPSQEQRSEMKTKAPLGSKETKNTVSSSGINNNSLSTSKTKSMEKLEVDKPPLETQNLHCKDSGNCGEKTPVSKPSAGSSVQTQQSN